MERDGLGLLRRTMPEGLYSPSTTTLCPLAPVQSVQRGVLLLVLTQRLGEKLEQQRRMLLHFALGDVHQHASASHTRVELRLREPLDPLLRARDFGSDSQVSFARKDACEVPEAALVIESDELPIIRDLERVVGGRLYPCNERSSIQPWYR